MSTGAQALAQTQAQEENKAIARRHFEELWARGDLTVADEIYSTSAVGRHLGSPDHGGYPECERQHVLENNTAFPDTSVTVEDQVAAGDRVVTRWTFRGSHTAAPYMGVPPSGRQISVSGVHIHRIVDGKIVEVWAYPDALSFLQQLGVIPPLG
jgi:steroid delta-isomerase-like uncharacterized protein